MTWRVAELQAPVRKPCLHRPQDIDSAAHCVGAAGNGRMAGCRCRALAGATTVDGASIAYQEVGEGSLALMVIHGWISHLEVYWEHPRFGQFMRRLSRGMRVL